MALRRHLISRNSSLTYTLSGVAKFNKRDLPLAAAAARFKVGRGPSWTGARIGQAKASERSASALFGITETKTPRPRTRLETNVSVDLDDGGEQFGLSDLPLAMIIATHPIESAGCESRETPAHSCALSELKDGWRVIERETCYRLALSIKFEQFNERLDKSTNGRAVESARRAQAV